MQHFCCIFLAMCPVWRWISDAQKCVETIRPLDVYRVFFFSSVGTQPDL